ncbi:AMP-dependent synthetase/ligase [Nesterenkonia cremea]|uniref:Acyl-CoA synthetase n=1 Tax=Nesterenkonia cremea TaxID=1882340 RepID=A0A917APP3_9MICC|nr:AMP-dependent synthetase/ligase [Nesterenkonia cremea]GGE66168.1 long-chain-fatty-acid--CoA ligase [Nesterenkonia cremea]
MTSTDSHTQQAADPTTADSPITESSTEQIAHLDDAINVTDGVLALLAASPDKAVYAVPNGAGGWVDVSITSFVEQVRRTAKGLIGLGVNPGDRVAVMSATSYSWAVIDQAIWFAGAVSVPIYETSSTHQISHLLAHSEAGLVLIGDEQLRPTVESAAKTASVEVEVLPFDSTAALAAIASHGGEVSDELLEKARSSAGLDDVATLVYTSGTTGKPKGVRITHRNLAEGAANLVAFADDILGEGESRTLLFLPLAHVLARAVQLACLHNGIQVAHSGSTENLIEDLGSYRPTWLLAVPRVFEKVFHGASAKAHSEGKGKIFDAAKSTAIAYSRAQQAQASGTGSGPSTGLKAKRALFAKLVYSKLHARMGGNVTHFVSGASPLDPEIAHFFTGIGLPVQEGYGLTESTAPITLNIPEATRIGSVGLPVPGSTVRIAEDGEVLLKGPVVFAGYHNAEKTTLGAFDADGFFRTGDLGELDADGFLTITGRKKELIVTAGGKNVLPTPLEEAVRAHRLVAQCVVVGDGRPFVGALVTLDAEALDGRSLEEAAADPTVREEIQQAVGQANERVSRAESIRKFEILSTELSEESGHLTPSMKLQRHKVIEDFSEQIEALFSS